ncbi:tubulin-like doman-containing protein [Bacillus sp. m3-13]|uniref:tubulin-like doman-containing protein n=1 Tax=Bacillus sp. m3-13 TaxID=406124 RepID=UPI0001E89FA2|nr:tubulin-like doman-containing protein [Bacillus sp. m3-13]
MANNAPTILVGLGGVGCTVVNTIFGNIPVERRDSVAVHAFDTDVNTIVGMEHLEGSITQTSTLKTVGQYLHGNPSLLTWFPDSPHLQDKSMTAGAGQVRSVSRLAFRAAMAEGKMNGLWDDIDKIFPVTTDKMVHGIRVIIISSLAGGTGSGIFLQVAMNIREMLKRKFGHSSILIRGAFLLPDILVNTRTINEREYESVRANGYASLKELNAIMMSATNQLTNSPDVTIDLEYRPNQVDIQGRNTHAIQAGQRPYDFCFLYDYENLQGKHLHSISQYVDQVSQTIYLQLFSPLSNKHFSQEDNQILQIIDSEGMGRYCGAAASTINYPYEDVVEYCALKWATSGLDESWLSLDRMFEEERNRYEKDLRSGINRERPEKGKRYIWHLEQLANGEKPNPFFKLAHNQVRVELDNGEYGDYKSSLFLKAVEEKVMQVLHSDSVLKMYENNCRPSDVRLNVRDHARKEISDTEANLALYYEQIKNKVYEYRSFIAHQVLDQDCDAPNGSEGQDYRLNTWFIQKPSPLHPVATRFMLYQISERINNKILEVRNQNMELKENIDNYKNVFDIRQTDRKETAIERVDMALNQKFLRALISNEFKSFISDYKTKSNRQLSNLNAYKEGMLIELVLTSINQAVQSMIRDWERFFDNLKDTRDSLLVETNQRSVKYEEEVDPTKEYVLATKELQENMWQSIRPSVDQGMLPDDISGQIYLSHYRQYCNRNEASYSNYVEELKVEELFRENVLAYCREELRSRFNDRLDLSIVQALRKEAQFKQVDSDEYLTERISSINQLSSPFIPRIDNARELIFWGIHTEASQHLKEQIALHVFGGKDIRDDAFSKYEIVSYKAHYGLSVSDFGKFSSGKKSASHTQEPGVYYESYRRRVDRLNKGGSTVTPHLDKRWHLPAFMPDLNPEQVKLDTEKNDRAFLLGLIHGYVYLGTEAGRNVYLYNGLTGTSLILKGGTVVPEEFYSLHNALSHNPAIYEEILDRAAAKEQEEIRRVKNIEEHTFLTGAKRLATVPKKGITSILDAVLAYETEGMGDETLPEIGQRLRETLLEEITGYFARAYGNHRATQARIDAAKLIESLWDDSEFRHVAEKNSTEYLKWKNLIEKTLNSLKQHS